MLVVLLVEGNAPVRHSVAKYLRERGLKVLEAVNGAEARLAVTRAGACRALSKAQPKIDVVLANITTPHCGFELGRWIRLQNPSIHVKLAGSVEKLVVHACTLGENPNATYEITSAAQQERHPIAVLERYRRGFRGHGNR